MCCTVWEIFDRIGLMKVRFWKTLIYLYSLLFFVTPLVMYSKTSELFEFNKLLTIYLITGCVAAVWTTRMLFSGKVIIRRRFFVYALLLFLSTQILSTFYSIDRHTSFFGYYGRFNGGLLSLIAYVLLSLGYISNAGVASQAAVRRTIEKILKTSLIASSLVMAWGLPSKFGYDLSCLVFTGGLNVSCWTDQFKPTERVFSTLGQPNWFGAYLAIHFFIACYFFLTNSQKKTQYIIYGYLFANMVFLVWTRSRSAIGAVLLAAIALFLYIFWRKEAFLAAEQRLKVGILALCLILPITLFGTGISKLDSVLYIGRFISAPSTQSVSQQSQSTGSGDIRKIVWQGAYSLGQAYPLFGTGVETFAYSYTFLRPVAHNFTTEWDYVYNKAHNELYNYFATSGFSGAGAYILLTMSTLLYGVYVFRRGLNKKDELLVLCLLLAYITILITNFLGFSTTTISLFYFMIPAWIIVLADRASWTPYLKSVQFEEKHYKMLILPGLMLATTTIFVLTYLFADKAYAKGENYFAASRYQEAVANLYTAYNLRNEHVYADKISQALTQIAFVQALSVPGEKLPACRDRDNSARDCIALAQSYNDKALEASSKNVMYYRTRARNNFYFYQITKDKKDYDRAVAAVRTARMLAPTDPRYPYYRALFALGDYELQKPPTNDDKKALEIAGLGSVQFAIQLKPDYVDAYLMKGLIEKELGRKEEARFTFEHILDKLDSRNEQAQKELKTL